MAESQGHEDFTDEQLVSLGRLVLEAANSLQVSRPATKESADATLAVAEAARDVGYAKATGQPIDHELAVRYIRAAVHFAHYAFPEVPPRGDVPQGRF